MPVHHTFATLLLATGTSPAAVADLLSHHSAAFTLEVCAHSTALMQHEAVETLNRLLNAR